MTFPQYTTLNFAWKVPKNTNLINFPNIEFSGAKCAWKLQAVSPKQNIKQAGAELRQAKVPLHQDQKNIFFSHKIEKKRQNTFLTE